MKIQFREHKDDTYCHMTMEGTPFRFTGQATKRHAYIAMSGGRTMFVGKPDPTVLRVYAGGKGCETALDGYDFSAVGGAILFVGETR